MVTIAEVLRSLDDISKALFEWVTDTVNKNNVDKYYILLKVLNINVNTNIKITFKALFENFKKFENEFWKNIWSKTYFDNDISSVKCVKYVK